MIITGIVFMVFDMFAILMLNLATRGNDNYIYKTNYLPEKYFIRDENSLKIYFFRKKIYKKSNSKKRVKVKSREKLKVTKAGYYSYLLGLLLLPIYIVFIILVAVGVVDIERKLYFYMNISYCLIVFVLGCIVSAICNWMNEYYYKKYKETARLDD